MKLSERLYEYVKERYRDDTYRDYLLKNFEREIKMYQKPMKYSPLELADMALDDLRSDIDFAERQAANGPFYPERGITRESLLKYAAEQRQRIRDLGGEA